MKLTAQEEYGLRCLLEVARRAPERGSAPASIREVAEAEGLSGDYAAKLLRVLRQAGLLVSERGATGGYRLARPPADVPLLEVLRVLDSPMYGADFCQAHAGQLHACTHDRSCTLRPVWDALEQAIGQVLGRMTLADLLTDATVVSPAAVAEASDV